MTEHYKYKYNVTEQVDPVNGRVYYVVYDPKCKILGSFKTFDEAIDYADMLENEYNSEELSQTAVAAAGVKFER